MDKDIEQIIAKALSDNIITDAEIEPCSKFLLHIRDVAIPTERIDEERYLPKDQPSPLEGVFNAAKTNGLQLGYLLGDFWETEFCEIMSKLDIYTHLLQRYKVFGAGHASINIAIPDREREDIKLPDVELYQLGRGLVAHVDVKHKQPFWAYPCVGIDFYDERVRLFGKKSLYYVIHLYSPTFSRHSFRQWKAREFEGWKTYWREYWEEYQNPAAKWSLNNNDEDWLAVKVTPGLKDILEEHGGPCINLKYFEPLKQVFGRYGHHAKSETATRGASR
jgi:hypothetical protein